MKKASQLLLLIISIMACIYLIYFRAGTTSYSKCIVDKEQYESIKSERYENAALFDGLIFEEEPLIYDESANTYYYSLLEKDTSATNPSIEIQGADNHLEIAFLEETITDELVQNNTAIPFLIYDEEAYGEYYLKCTTLPIMNIECAVDQLSDVPTTMQMTLFDNRAGTAVRVSTSAGTLHVRGNTTTIFPKQGYRFSLAKLNKEGIVTSNQISLLGMRKDEDWLLYAAYNDQEKIRNVFSSNLWQYSCAKDNSLGINAGMEYKYVELFLNGQYWGLYALGYPVDEKQLGLDPYSEKEGFYKAVTWFPNEIVWTEGGNVTGFRLSGTNDILQLEWDPLVHYFDVMKENTSNNEVLRSGIDLDNAMDVYLFTNLMQGLDHAMGGINIKNYYVGIKDVQGTSVAVYAPWDMDITWGNSWNGDPDTNLTGAYEMPVENNVFMNSGYLGQLLANNDPQVWEQLIDKYDTLRKNEWSDESVMQLLDLYEEQIYDSGAFRRDMQRWPEGSYNSPDDKLSTFKVYVHNRLAVMDQYIEEVKLNTEM